MKQITIDRWNGEREVERQNWKDLISALALVGYEVYADEERIVFTLGDSDKVEEAKDE